MCVIRVLSLRWVHELHTTHVRLLDTLKAMWCCFFQKKGRNSLCYFPDLFAIPFEAGNMMLKGRNRNEIELQLWQYYSSSVLRDLEINVLGGQYQRSWREYQLWWHYFDNKERRGKLISFTTGSPLRPIPVSLEDILLKEVNELLLGFLWTFDFSTFNSFWKCRKWVLITCRSPTQYYYNITYIDLCMPELTLVGWLHYIVILKKTYKNECFSKRP